MSEAKFPRRTVLRAMTIGAIGTAGVHAGGSAAGAAPLARELRAGMSGPDVAELQVRVAGWAADEARQILVPVSGVFDPATDAALRRFQRAYGLDTNGVAGSATQDRLAALAKPDGSTANFDWAQFASPDGSGFADGEVNEADEAAVREQVRRLMYKLEALRHKLGGRTVVVVDGFHSTDYRARQRGGQTESTHIHGGAADITVAGLTTYAVYRVAQTCGFTGLGSFVQSWLHVDTSTGWSWASGTIG